MATRTTTTRCWGIFKDLDNENVVRAREKLEAELRRLEGLKTPQERVKDLDTKLSQVRNAVGCKAFELARAHQTAQEAQERVDRLEAELQASLVEVQNLEVQQDQFKAQLPPSHNQTTQEESPEERECACAIAVLVRHGGDTMHVQQCINELQDKYLRLGADRMRTQAVRDDGLEHGLPAEPPWPLQEGSPIRETVINQGSLATQRHILDYCKSKSKGKGSTARIQHTGKGKGPSRNVPAAEAVPAGPTASESATAAGPASSPPPSTPPPPTTPQQDSHGTPPPWRSQPPPTKETDPTEHAAMEDPDGPERGSKRPAEPPESTRNQDEEDEFQEAARYRRGDGHLT